MAELLRKQYEEVFSVPEIQKEITNAEHHFRNNNETQSLVDVSFDERDIIEAIKDISINSAAGPDEIPAILLKKCKETIAKTLTTLWRKSLDMKCIPSTLKEGNIIPIYKSGNKGQAKNYRPVTLTSHIIKIFERIIRKKIVNYLEQENKINPGQHGFRKGRSCLSQILNHYENILKDLIESREVDVIYLDFAKAFDKVDHGILLHKINDIGIKGKLGEWIHNFLTNRKQKVMINGTFSRKSNVRSGVPQGSVLGPLLFLIMIGDIDKDIKHSRVTSFADDTRISTPLSLLDGEDKPKEDLEAVCNWARENSMKFNSDKLEIIR